ncbi:MAG: nuclease-related domain-containing protein [Caldiserica bacterium]|nr:nuclease-related domain-containing protein [Caldisericota bacterium]
MAQVHGKAGGATYHAGDRLMYRALIPMLVMGILTYLLFRQGVRINGLLGAGVWFIVGALGFWCAHGIFRLETAADRYYGGAGGEYDVGAVLSRLPEEFHVFNGLGFYGGDVDHVVVGPTGVFVIETKNHSGTIGIKNGRLSRNGESLNCDVVRQATLEARYVKGRLSPADSCYVRSVIVFVKARVRVKTRIEGVRVIGLSSLIDTIVSGVPSLSAQDVLQYTAQLQGVDMTVPSRPARDARGELRIDRVSLAGVAHPGFARIARARRSR